MIAGAAIMTAAASGLAAAARPPSELPSATAAGAVAVAVVMIAAAVAPVARRAVSTSDPSAPGTSRHRVASRWIGWLDRLHTAHRNRRTRTATADEVADWCEALARQTRSGVSLRRAVETVEPAAAALQRRLDPMRHRLERGTPLLAATAAGDTDTTTDNTTTDTTETTADTATRAGDGGDLGLALDMIGVAVGLGGSPAAVLDRTASTLRQRAADRAERRTQAAQARMSAHVLTVVPLGLLVLLVLSDQGIRAAVATPVGAACIGGGLLLNGLGWIWMRAVIGAPR